MLTGFPTMHAASAPTVSPLDEMSYGLDRQNALLCHDLEDRALFAGSLRSDSLSVSPPHESA